MEVITAAIQSSAEKSDRFVTKSVYMKWLSLLILLGSIYFSYKTPNDNDVFTWSYT
jgi:hypothetical protein